MQILYMRRLKSAPRGDEGRLFHDVMQCEECPGDADLLLGLEAGISCVAASCVYGPRRSHSAAAAVAAAAAPKDPRTARSLRPSNVTINEVVYYATTV